MLNLKKYALKYLKKVIKETNVFVMVVHFVQSVMVQHLINLIKNLQKTFNQIETWDLRVYLNEYQKRSFYLKLCKT
ncbi:MAG: hypothetical protein IIW80_04725 [Treponema sp.]|nr:hypothetical protein [Treponema sp.]